MKTPLILLGCVVGLALLGCAHTKPAAAARSNEAVAQQAGFGQVWSLAAKYLSDWVRTNPSDSVWANANVMEIIPTKVGWEVQCRYRPGTEPSEEMLGHFLIIQIKHSGEFDGVGYGRLII